MPHIHSNRRKPAIAVLVILLASLLLAACGGSSNSSSSNASANASASTTGGAGATGPGPGRFAAVRECLQKNGITLPKRTPGTRRTPGAGGFFGGATGPHLPAGVTRAQYEAAIKKCGGGAFPGRGARLKNPAYQQALTKFAACMRENGVNLPAPNTSGTGPIFDTKGLKTTSSQFAKAQAKCRSDLRGAFQGPSNAAGPPQGSGGPPAGPGGAPEPTEGGAPA